MKRKVLLALAIIAAPALGILVIKRTIPPKDTRPSIIEASKDFIVIPKAASFPQVEDNIDDPIVVKEDAPTETHVFQLQSKEFKKGSCKDPLNSGDCYATLIATNGNKYRLTIIGEYGNQNIGTYTQAVEGKWYECEVQPVADDSTGKQWYIHSGCKEYIKPGIITISTA